MVLLVTLIAVEFLVSMGDLGCGQPILMSDWCMETIALVQIESPSSLAPAAENTTNLMMCAMVSTSTEPLKAGTGLSWESMM